MTVPGTLGAQVLGKCVYRCLDRITVYTGTVTGSVYVYRCLDRITVYTGTVTGSVYTYRYCDGVSVCIQMP